MFFHIFQAAKRNKKFGPGLCV